MSYAFIPISRRHDPFENRLPDKVGDDALSGSESEDSNEDTASIQTPPIKLAMWVSWYILYSNVSYIYRIGLDKHLGETNGLYGAPTRNMLV